MSQASKIKIIIFIFIYASEQTMPLLKITVIIFVEEF